MPELRPLISVCITAYNHAHYIRESLSSVLEQRGEFDIEILVGDDGSTDETRDILTDLAQHFPEKISLFFHHANLGASGNLCFLIERARGAFIAHLDGDDFWLQDKLLRQLRMLQANPDCVAVYGNGRVVNEKGMFFAMFHSSISDSKLTLATVVERGNFLFHSSLLYRADVKDAILGIPGAFIDFRMHIHLAARGPMLLSNEPIAVYRHASSSSMIRHMPNAVFQFYWEALQDAARLGVADSAHQAASLFWERIFITALRNFKFVTIVRWWNKCGESSLVRLGLAERLWLTFRSMRLIALALYSRFQKPESRVLYRR